MSDAATTAISLDAASELRRSGLRSVPLAGPRHLVVALFAVGDLARSVAARGWKTVRGTIAASEIKRDVLTYNVSARGRKYATTASHFCRTYQYIVNGRQYTGGRIDALTANGADSPHEYMRRYPRGADVRAHVNPSDPMQAVLETPWPVATTFKAIGP